MMIKILIAMLIVGLLIPLYAIKDDDLDGVPNNLDQCLKTPFLNEVNAKGCTVRILVLPSESEYNSLNFSLSYGYSTNEELSGRTEQQVSKVQLNYYDKDMSYTLDSGYYNYNSTEGLVDTNLRIKKRFKFSSQLRYSIGVGIKFPTYDFVGNKIDYSVSNSLTYYPTRKISLFSSFNYTFVNDESQTSFLQDTRHLTTGLGYFFTKTFYGNISYTQGKTKFRSQDSVENLSSMIYYKINKKWFNTALYREEINGIGSRKTYYIKLGYKIW